jgi:nucleotide-binding universal stress UspA family protein
MKILVATGGAPHSNTAVAFTSQLASRPEDTVTLLTVIKTPSEQAQAQARLDHARQLIDHPDSQLDTQIRLGQPAEKIVRETEEGVYDVVVVGDRQHHRLVTRFLLGSTASRVVEHSPHPVIIAKGQIKPVRRLLLCDSGFAQPSIVSRFASQMTELIERADALTILHVMSQISAGPGVPGAQLRATTAELMAAQTPEGALLADDIDLLSPYPIQPQPKVRHGRVVDEILGEAREGDYDLVIIGAHRGEGWRRILLDDLAHQIITHIDRPVLVLR